MKKILVAGAALMLAGSMVSAASAEDAGKVSLENAGISITGDAEFVYTGLMDYRRRLVPPPPQDTTENGYGDFFSSRVGLNFDAKAFGGSTVSARMYFDNDTYDGDAKWNGYEKQEVTVDYAYLTVPLGNNLTLKAGRLPLDFSEFYSWDLRATRMQVIYKTCNLTLVPWLGVKNEGESSTSPIPNAWDDNDFMQYGLVTKFRLHDSWKLKGFFRYNNDQRALDEGAPAIIPPADQSGFDGSVNLTGTIVNVGLTAEVSYKEADYQGTPGEDGIGGYVQAAFYLPAFTPILIAGMTQDRFQADEDFGFVMVGGNEATMVQSVGNAKGDLMFGALVMKHNISDRFSAQGNVLYADFDYDTVALGANELDSAIEVSGALTYAISDSTSLTYKAGYLAPNYNDKALNVPADSVLEEVYYGHLLRMAVDF